MALTHLGEADLARELLAAAAGGSLTGDGAQGRLIAAGHSLMTRGALEVKDDGSVELDEGLARVVRPLARSDTSIRVSYSDGGPEVVQTYHFASGDIVQHDVDRDIIYTLTPHDSVDSVVASCMAFFAVEGLDDFEAEAAELPAGILDEIQQTADRAEVDARLAEAGLPEPARKIFIDDFQGVVYRGSLLQIRYGEDGVPQSDGSTLLLRGPNRLWLMRAMMEEGDDSLRMLLIPGSKAALDDELRSLISSGLE